MPQLRFTLTPASTGTPIEVEDPKGWDSFTISAERDELAGGFLFALSTEDLSLEFWGPSYDIIKNEYELDEENAVVTVLIEDVSGATDVTLFEGYIRFESVEFDLDNCIARVGVDTFNPIARIQARADQKIDLLGDGVEGADLSNRPQGTVVTILDQPLLKGTLRSSYSTSPDTFAVAAPFPAPAPADPPTHSLRNAMPSGRLYQDIEAEYDQQLPTLYTGTFPGSAIGNSYTFPSGVKDYTFILKYDNLRIQFTPGMTITEMAVEFKLGESISSVAIPITETTANQDYNTGAGIVEIAVTTSLTTVPVFVEATWKINTGSGDCTYTFTNFQVFASFDEDSGVGDTFCRVLFAHEAMYAACNVLTDGLLEDGDLQFESQLLGKPDTLYPPSYGYSSVGEGAYLTFTNGRNVRLLPENGLNFTFEELAETIVYSYAAGIGVESFADSIPRIRVEGREFFYDRSSTPLFILDKYRDLFLSPFEDQLYTHVVQGFEDYEVETLSGYYDLHTEQTWAAPTRTSLGKREHIIPTIGSTFLIETQRRKAFDTDGNRSSDEDSKLYVLQVEPNYLGGYQSVQFDQVEYDQFPLPIQIRNIDIHPVRSLLRWLPWLNKEILCTAVEGYRDYSVPNSFPIWTGLTDESPNIAYGISDVPTADTLIEFRQLKLETPYNCEHVNAFREYPYRQVVVKESDTKYSYWFIHSLDVDLGGSTISWILQKSTTPDDSTAPTTLV